VRAAVFLDKDGTLVENVPYNADPARIALRPGASEALRLLAGLGYELVVVSNQPGVAHGRFAWDALRGVEEHLVRAFRGQGFHLTGFQWCPHDPEGRVPEYSFACTCRKPKPGMLHAAAAEHGLDLERSWMVGDILDDVEAGHRAGCRSVLVDVGNETEWKRGLLRLPDFTVPDLLSAAAVIQAATSLQAREVVR
jgi:D-glycero-D-manno-heptose 1,7-bisphosphate phosphatase